MQSDNLHTVQFFLSVLPIVNEANVRRMIFYMLGQSDNVNQLYKMCGNNRLHEL